MTNNNTNEKCNHNTIQHNTTQTTHAHTREKQSNEITINTKQHNTTTTTTHEITIEQ